MKVLFHVAVDLQGDPLTAVFIDGNGKRYEVPSGEPTEITSDFMAEKIMEHCHYYGIVEVQQVRTQKGIDWNIDDATDRATEALTLSEKKCINDYITTQLESRVMQNKPPLPPIGRALDCVIKHKYNLSKAGIHPVGWEPPYSVEASDQRADGTYHIQAKELEERIRHLEEENQKLLSEMRAFMRATAIKDLQQKGTTAKPKTGPAVAPVTDPAETVGSNV